MSSIAHAQMERQEVKCLATGGRQLKHILSTLAHNGFSCQFNAFAAIKVFTESYQESIRYLSQKSLIVRLTNIRLGCQNW